MDGQQGAVRRGRGPFEGFEVRHSVAQNSAVSQSRPWSAPARLFSRGALGVLLLGASQVTCNYDKVVRPKTNPPLKYAFQQPPKTIRAGDTLPLSVTVYQNGAPVSYPLRWGTLDPALIQVDNPTGLVRARDSLGLARVTVGIRSPFLGTPSSDTLALTVTVGRIRTSVAASSHIALSSFGEADSITDTATDVSGAYRFTSDSLIVAIPSDSSFLSVDGPKGGQIKVRAKSANGTGSVILRTKADTTVMAVVPVSVRQVADTLHLAVRGKTKTLTFGSLGSTDSVVAIPYDSGASAILTIPLQHHWLLRSPTLAVLSPVGDSVAVQARLNGNAWLVDSAVDSGRVARDSLAITIQQVAATLTPSAASLAFGSLGDTLTINITAADSGVHPVIGRPLRWASSDASVVAVDSLTGHLQLRKNGAVSLTASEDAATATVRVTVQQVVAHLAVTPDSIPFRSLQDTLHVSAVATDSSGAPIPGIRIVWSTSTPAVATVDTSGLVRGITNGTSLVIATAGGRADSVLVRVAQVVRAVVVSPALDTLFLIGDSTRLVATARDSLGHPIVGAHFTWSGDSASVVTVDTTGLVKNLSAGTATVSATDSGITGHATIVALDTVTAVAVTVNPKANQMLLGQSVVLTATAHNALGHVLSNALIAWASRDSGIVKVDPLGRVRPLEYGAAFIVASSGSRADSSMVTVSTPAVSLTCDTPRVEFADLFSKSALDPSWQVVGGTWSVSSGQLDGTWDVGSAQSDQGNLLLDTTRYAFDSVLARVEFISGKGNDGAFSLWNSVGNKYNVLFQAPTATTPGILGVEQRKAGAFYSNVFYVDSVPGFAAAGDTNVIAIEKADSNVTVYLNGRELLTFADTVFHGALQVGLDAYGDRDFYHFTACHLDPVASISLSATAVNLQVGQTVTLVPTLYNQAGNRVSRRVTWTSSDSTIAAVDNAGTVSGRGSGIATVIATAEGVSAPATISIGTSLSFDGATSYAIVPSSPTLDAATFTVEAWVRLSTDATEQARIINRQNMGGEQGWGLEIFGQGYGTSTGNEVVFHSGNCALVNEISTGFNLQAGTWYHLAASNDGDSLRVYVDSLLVGTAPSGGQTCTGNSVPLVIGTDGLSPFNQFFFPGLVDEVRLWNVARSQSDIVQNLRTYLSASTPGLIGYWHFDEGTGTTAADATANGNTATLVSVLWALQTW